MTHSHCFKDFFNISKGHGSNASPTVVLYGVWNTKGWAAWGRLTFQTDLLLEHPDQLMVMDFLVLVADQSGR